MTAETVALTVRVPQEMADALRTHAFVCGSSVNDVVKQAVVEYLRGNARTDMVRSAFDRVLADHEVALEKLANL